MIKFLRKLNSQIPDINVTYEITFSKYINCNRSIQHDTVSYFSSIYINHILENTLKF